MAAEEGQDQLMHTMLRTSPLSARASSRGSVTRSVDCRGCFAASPLYLSLLTRASSTPSRTLAYPPPAVRCAVCRICSRLVAQVSRHLRRVSPKDID